LYSLSVINSFVEFSVGSISYTDEESIKLQEKGEKGEGRRERGKGD
jgi:hypothetical protein